MEIINLKVAIEAKFKFILSELCVIERQILDTREIMFETSNTLDSLLYLLSRPPNMDDFRKYVETNNILKREHEDKFKMAADIFESQLKLKYESLSKSLAELKLSDEEFEEILQKRKSRNAP